MDFYRVSSSWTLFFKIFIPTSWIIFFGALSVIVLIVEKDTIPIFRTAGFQLGIISFMLIGILALYFSLMRLKRVEFAADGFFVTNYFKTFKYSYQSIIKISQVDFLVLKILFIRFPQSGSFGKRIFFIKRSKVWKEFVSAFPQHFSHLEHVPL